MLRELLSDFVLAVRSVDEVAVPSLRNYAVRDGEQLGCPACQIVKTHTMSLLMCSSDWCMSRSPRPRCLHLFTVCPDSLLPNNDAKIPKGNRKQNTHSSVHAIKYFADHLNGRKRRVSHTVHHLFPVY